MEFDDLDTTRSVARTRMRLAGSRSPMPSAMAVCAEDHEPTSSCSVDASSAELSFDIRLLEALIALRRSDRYECHRLLAALFATPALPHLASSGCSLKTAAIAELCAESLRAGIAIDAVHSLIESHRLAAPPSVERDWPWPFAVCVLGKFKLLKGSVPIGFSRRAQKRTLELLQVLIAFGGTDVSSALLIDALWPDSEGDAGYHALESTLYRLRVLLGAPAAVTMTGSQLSLSRGYFWVDLWAFDEALRAGGTSPDPVGSHARIQHLYAGHFLEHETDKQWALKTRQCLRDKYLRSLRQAAQWYEVRSQWQLAANVYQAGIELDGMAEDLYRGLMICYRELGEDSEVLKIYGQCRDLMDKVLGVRLSPKTDAIYQSVRRQSAAATP